MPDELNTGPPTKPQNLPDFKPKGMARGDRVAAWTMAFLIVITLIVFANRALNERNYNDTHKPAVKATATATAKPGKTAKDTASNSCPMK
jgi:hypothetical protein